MNPLSEAAQQALGFVTSEAWGTTPYMDVRVYEDAARLRDVLQAALAQQVDPAQEQDAELSAALGWPGGISNPVLDRKVLLQKVAALMRDKLWEDHRVRHLWDQAQEQAEPVPGAWVASPDGRVIYDDVSADDDLLRVSGDFENDEQRIRYAQRIVDKLNAAPPKDEPVQEPVAKCIDDICSEHLGRVEAFDHLPKGTLLYTIFPRRTMVPLTEEEIYHATGHYGVSEYTAINIARAIEEASWEKNNG